MIIHLYCLSWNEMAKLDFFFDHYDRFVDHYFFRDDGSTDGTRQYLLGKTNVTLKDKENPHADSYVLNSLHSHNTHWKESRGRADWVIVVDVDEFIYHSNIVGYLEDCRGQGVTAVPALGFQMVSRHGPKSTSRLTRDFVYGAPWAKMSKLALFRPDDIDSTNFSVGRHSAAPAGRVRYPDQDCVLLLHYKYLGLERVADRHAKANLRRGRTDLENKWGHRHAFSPRELADDFEQFESRSIDYRTLTDLHTQHVGQRWWRK